MHTKQDQTIKNVCLNDYPISLRHRIEKNKADPAKFLPEASKAVGFTLSPNNSIDYEHLYETIKKHVVTILKITVGTTASIEPFVSKPHLIGGLEFMFYWSQVYEQTIDHIVKGYKNDDEDSKQLFALFGEDLKKIPCCFYAKHVVIVGMNGMVAVIQANLDCSNLSEYLAAMDGINVLTSKDANVI
jgi:hypothetical protein